MIQKSNIVYNVDDVKRSGNVQEYSDDEIQFNRWEKRLKKTKLKYKRNSKNFNAYIIKKCFRTYLHNFIKKKTEYVWSQFKPACSFNITTSKLKDYHRRSFFSISKSKILKISDISNNNNADSKTERLINSKFLQSIKYQYFNKKLI
uniref:Uncharacterized protein n=1 Tax=Amorphochlora amoebiformis TaxID=1561963 RepID=A0A0H5BIK4_9EUKA|nr:hypothetical protein [Amorphochlora amoebiformis]